jgi:HK97 gp10 family phage protein
MNINLINLKIKEYMEKRAKVIYEKSRDLCPVRTGNLRDSIKIVKGEGKYNYLIGSDLDYAYWVEMGTNKESPEPFLRPALDEKYESIVNTKNRI